MATTRFRFRFRDAFPPDSRLAHWLVMISAGLNDLVLVNRWLTAGLANDAPAHENLYRTRLSAMHGFEVAKFLRDGMAEQEVVAFVGTLPSVARADLETILSLFDEANPVRKEFRRHLESSRHLFSHYEELKNKSVRKALKAFADEHGEMVVGDRLAEHRALFADDIGVLLFFSVDDEAAFRRFASDLADFTTALMRFCEEALVAHLAGLDGRLIDRIDDADPYP